MLQHARDHTIKKLHQDILHLQGFKPANNPDLDGSLGVITEAFPNASFPLGAMHEFLTTQQEDAASTTGFIAALLSVMMRNGGAALWISSSGKIFPPALKSFGLNPNHFIFVNLRKDKELLWTMEEALKCSALSAVVGEMQALDFTASRRFQLAVEQSQVTGFIMRSNAKVNTTACVSRWKISAQASIPIAASFPGIGFPQWKVDLLRIRNGKPGSWNVQWREGKLQTAHAAFPSLSQTQHQKAG